MQVARTVTMGVFMAVIVAMCGCGKRESTAETKAEKQEPEVAAAVEVATPVEEAPLAKPQPENLLEAGDVFAQDKSNTEDTSPAEFKTVTIGSQVWMAENLNVATFRNGDTIPEVKSAADWLAAYRAESPAWCYYNNDPKNGEKYGKLYNWYAVNDPRGLAPVGWHVPRDKEWQTMISSVGGMSKAFGELKKSEGFAAEPAGSRWFKDASFLHLGNITFWWSASKNDKWNAWYHAMHFGYKQVGRDNGGMNTGHSVRLVKDKVE